MSKLQKGIVTILSLFVLFELALYFGVNDLDLWLKYGNLENKFAICMEILGLLVAPILFIAGGVIIAYYYLMQNNMRLRKTKIVIAIFCSIGGFAYSVTVFMKLQNIFFTIALSLLFCLLSFLLIILIKKLEPGRLFQMYCIALTAVIYCIAVLAVISTIKLFWGRIRPRDLQSLSEFTRWYLPQGITGNTSFPSGHTGNASTLLLITMFIPLVKKTYQKVLLAVIPAIWIVLMAYSRIVIGAHYFSDTLFAIAISITLFILIKKLTIYLIAKSLSSESDSDSAVNDTADEMTVINTIEQK